MTGIMIFIGYLLIGAILGWMDHKMFDTVVRDSMVKTSMPYNFRTIFISASVICIIILAPILWVIDIVMKLKPKK
jgi:hypothetical protein